jgi:tRNA threonylcarbamoyladenosine biosynthesis protein TsaB
MLVLGIETTTSVLSIAILKDKEIISEYSIVSSKNHSALLLPAIESQLKINNIQPKEIGLIAVSIGPGSFTGVRVGLSLAKGISFSLGIPIIGIPTLDALAKGVGPRMGIVCPVLDAKKNQIYSALYKTKEGRLEKFTDYFSKEFDELCRIIDITMKENKEKNILFTGEGLLLYESKLENKFGKRANFVSLRIVNAVSVAKLGIEKFQANQIDNIYKLAPLYVRNPDVKEPILQTIDHKFKAHRHKGTEFSLRSKV